MRKIIALATAVVCLTATSAAFAQEFKDRTPLDKLYRQRATTATLSNGTGDGTVTVTVDGYGAFGSRTYGSDAIYDPVGPDLEARGTVFQSAVFFGPARNFLSAFGLVSTGLRPVTVTMPDSTTAESSFRVAGFRIDLVQTLKKGSAGSTLEQVYTITNLSRVEKTVQLVRHVDGDLYFVGGLTNDFAGVSPDGETLFEFDEGDDPAEPTTYLGISATGGESAGFTIQSYRYTDDIVSAGGIPSSDLGEIEGDDNGDLVTDDGYDVTLSKQNTLVIPARQSAVYTTRTVFGEGSINQATASTSGCLLFNGSPLGGVVVTATQPQVPDQETTTDEEGCFAFDRLVSGKTFGLTVEGPVVP